MKIHLYDCDKTNFPNLALLKLSAWHKARGDSVIWNMPLFPADLNYSSRVFTWSNKPPPGDYLMGGYVDSQMTLDDEIEHTCPDYNGMNYSLGYLSRGCIRTCKTCIVPDKEGMIQPHSKPEDFIRHKEVVLMDNNWLASPRWESDYEYLKCNAIRVDFNQGLDARLVDMGVAKRLVNLDFVQLPQMNWKWIRFACDSDEQKEPLKKAVAAIRSCGYKHDFFVYVLIEEIEDALDRIEFCRSLDLQPFAQPYRDKTGKVNSEFAHLARWCNHKAIFKSIKWEDYKP